jgi:membrane protein YdbS with pleckstrin-like domain
MLAVHVLGSERWRLTEMLFLLLLIVLILAVIPSWPYSRGWGYYPSGGLGLVLLVVVILLLMGRI